MYTAQLPETNSPFSIRYPRGNGAMIDWKKSFQKITIGKGRRIQNGEDIAILTIGHVGNFAVAACKQLEKKNISTAHYDMRFVKPIDEELLHEVFKKHSRVITIEDGCIMGGMGSAVIEFMADNNYNAQVKRLGIPDKYIEHGEQAELHIECGFDTDSIVKTAIEIIGLKKNTMTG